MPWFKVDDALPANHKVLSIPRGPRRLAAVGAWTLAGAWTAANLQEGKIPTAVVGELGISARAVLDLVAAGLWLEVEGGYLMHDFLDYNPSAEQVRKDRADAAERQRRAREKAKASRRDSRVTHTVSHGPPDPTRPDPSFVLGFRRDEEVEVDVPDEDQTSPRLSLVEAVECEHGDPHPELCARCAAQRRRSA